LDEDKVCKKQKKEAKIGLKNEVMDEIEKISNVMNLILDGLDKSEEWTESFTDFHPTKPHPAPGDTCQDKWQRLS
jgi:hypothetical protein